MKIYVNEILENHKDTVKTMAAINEIHKIFFEKTQFSGFDQEMRLFAAVPTATGSALSINYAAQCLLDYNRTSLLLRGLVNAIEDKQKEYPGETIEIFYAGCGPYAPFAAMLASVFTKEEVMFTLLEINGESVMTAKKLIEGLEIGEYVRDFYVADAITFKIPDAERYHILLSETLDARLYRESYVPILWNLIPQLSIESVVIPQNVLLSTCTFKTMAATDETIEIDLLEETRETLFDVRKTLAEIGQTELPTEMGSKEKPFPTLLPDHGLLLETHVEVYKEILLDNWKSQLTVPINLNVNDQSGHSKMKYRYQLKPSIEFQYEFE